MAASYAGVGSEQSLSQLWSEVLKIPRPEELNAYILDLFSTMDAAYSEVMGLEQLGIPTEEAMALVLEKYDALAWIDAHRSAVLGIKGYP